MRGMRRLLVDTNALIDGMASSRPQHEEARSLVPLAREAGFELWVLASSLKNAYYLLCRHYHDEPTARRAISAIRGCRSMAPLTRETIGAALASDEPDLEDGLVRAAAEALCCSAIVSRDVRAFERSSVRRLDASGASRLMLGAR